MSCQLPVARGEGIFNDSVFSQCLRGFFSRHRAFTALFPRPGVREVQRGNVAENVLKCCTTALPMPDFAQIGKISPVSDKTFGTMGKMRELSEKRNRKPAIPLYEGRLALENTGQ